MIRNIFRNYFNSLTHFRLIILTLFTMTILTSCLFSQKSILKSFSLVRNLGSFFKVREDESMSYLRGIKTISYLSVIFLHVLLFSYYYPSNNSQKVYEFRNGLAKNTMVSSFSGLSVCYTIGSLLATKAIIKLIKMWVMILKELIFNKFFILEENSIFHLSIFIASSVLFPLYYSSSLLRNTSFTIGWQISLMHHISIQVKWKRFALIYGCPWHSSTIIFTL